MISTRSRSDYNKQQKQQQKQQQEQEQQQEFDARTPNGLNLKRKLSACVSVCVSVSVDYCFFVCFFAVPKPKKSSDRNYAENWLNIWSKKLEKVFEFHWELLKLNIYT